jgi:hypothetical protein
LFVPGGRSFVPACDRQLAARKGPSRLAVALSLRLAPVLLGHALTAPSTARRSSRSGRHRAALRTGSERLDLDAVALAEKAMQAAAAQLGGTGAAEAFAEAGDIERAITIMLDVEQPIYEATRLLNAVSLLNRRAES